jgi:hypothetical protein
MTCLSEVPKIYTAEDGARPVIGYTLAVANQRQVYLHFSEPVYGDATQSSSIALGDIAEAANPPTVLLPLETSGFSAHGAMLTLTSPILPGDIVPYATAQTVAAISGTSIYDIGRDVQPRGHANTNDDGFLPPNDKPMLTTAHRLSDVGLGLADNIRHRRGDPAGPGTRGGVGADRASAAPRLRTSNPLQINIRA